MAGNPVWKVHPMTTPTPPPVARYDLDQGRGYTPYASMVKDDTGEYVLASDYDRLAAECERLRRALGWVATEARACVGAMHGDSFGQEHMQDIVNIATEALTPTSKEPQQ